MVAALALFQLLPGCKVCSQWVLPEYFGGPHWRQCFPACSFRLVERQSFRPTDGLVPDQDFEVLAGYHPTERWPFEEIVATASSDGELALLAKALRFPDVEGTVNFDTHVVVGWTQFGCHAVSIERIDVMDDVYWPRSHTEVCPGPRRTHRLLALRRGSIVENATWVFSERSPLELFAKAVSLK